MFLKKELHTIIEILEKILKVGREILTALSNKKMHIIFFTENVQDWKGLDMDLQLFMSPTASALGVPVETLADGTPFTFDPTQIEWAVQDINVVNFTPNSDGTALFKPVGLGSSRIAVTDKATGATKVVQCNVVPVPPPPNQMDIVFQNVTP